MQHYHPKLKKEEPKYAHDYEKAGFTLMYSASWVQGDIHELVKPFDLTFQQYNVLRIVNSKYPEPVNLKYVKERMVDRMPDVSRMIDKMVKTKLLDRKVQSEDKRNIEIYITEKGLNLLNDLNFLEQHHRRMFKNLNDKEIKLLLGLLEKAQIEN